MVALSLDYQCCRLDYAAIDSLKNAFQKVILLGIRNSVRETVEDPSNNQVNRGNMVTLLTNVCQIT